MSLLGCTSEHLYKVFRQQMEAWQLVMEAWNLTEELGQVVLRQIWAKELAPKICTFLWMLAQHTLLMWERQYDWLVEMCIAVCDEPGCKAPNTIPHIFFYCRRAAAL